MENGNILNEFDMNEGHNNSAVGITKPLTSPVVIIKSIIFLRKI